MYSTGLRSNEVVNLSEHVIDFEKNEMKIIGKIEREVPFSESAKIWIKKYIELKKADYKNYTKDILITNSRGGKLTTRSLRRLISNYAKKSGITREVSTHSFRHTYAIRMLNSGKTLEEMQKLLGHVSILTMKMYL